MGSETPEQRREWSARHYAKHRAAIRQKQRIRYALDSQYADRIREQRNAHVDRHRERINAERRERIARDPDYSERIKAYHEEFRERIRNGYIPKTHPLFLSIKKTEQRVFRLIDVARILGCAYQTIHRWTCDGWLPSPCYEIRGRNVYSANQVALIGHFYEQGKYDHDGRTQASKLAFKKWKNE